MSLQEIDSAPATTSNSSMKSIILMAETEILTKTEDDLLYQSATRDLKKKHVIFNNKMTVVFVESFKKFNRKLLYCNRSTSKDQGCDCNCLIN